MNIAKQNPEITENDSNIIEINSNQYIDEDGYLIKYEINSNEYMDEDGYLISYDDIDDGINYELNNPDCFEFDHHCFDYLDNRGDNEYFDEDGYLIEYDNFIDDPLDYIDLSIY